MNKTIVIIITLIAVLLGFFYVQKNNIVEIKINKPFVNLTNETPIEKKDAEEDYSNINIKSISKNNTILLETLQKIGTEKAMELLVKESGGGSIYDCHQESHQIGRIGYKIEKEKAFKSCDASCHSGCYHGAMESLLIEKGTENLAENITAVCKNFETSFGNFECLHGVGHGILAYVDYDMPQAIIDCKKLPDSFSQSSCHGGMFMENILTGQGLGASQDETHQTEWVNKKDPYFPCNAIDQDYALQYQCYQMQTSWMLTLSGHNFDKVAEQCLKAPNNMQQACFISFGRDAAGYTLRNPKKIVDICSKVPQENGYYFNCIAGALNVIIDFWGPELKGQASEMCSILPENDKQICYQVLANRLTGIFKEKSDQLKVCSTFEQSYRNLCENGS